MAKIVWRRRADQSLYRIGSYIAQHDEDAAIRYVTGIRDTVSALADFPERGPRYNATFRIVFFRNHVVFYRYDKRLNTVFVTDVIDARRDVASIVKDLRD